MIISDIVVLTPAIISIHDKAIRVRTRRNLAI